MSVTRTYILEIFEPGSTDDVVAIFKDASPFLAIHRGDFLNHQLWGSTPSPTNVLRVTSVEHIIWASEGENILTHKLCVYTEEIENTRKSRHPVDNGQ